MNTNIWYVKWELKLDSLLMTLHPGRSLLLQENNLQRRSMTPQGKWDHLPINTRYPYLKINALNIACHNSDPIISKQSL